MSLSGRLPSLLRIVNSTASLLIGLVAQTLAFILLARHLGAEELGALATITSVSGITMCFTGLGSSECMRRRYARDPTIYPEALGHALILTIGIGVASLIASTLLLSHYVHVAADPIFNLATIALLILANSLLFLWVGLVEQVLLAHEKVNLANVVNAGFGLLRLVFAVVACLGFGVASVRSWAVWNVVCSIVAAIGCGALIVPFGRPRWTLLRDELPLGTTMSLSALLHIFRLNVDVIALSAAAPASVVGTYSVVRRILGTASVGAMNLDRLIYGKLAKAGVDGVGGLIRLGRHYAGYATLLGFVTSLGLIVIAPWVPVVFGAKFDDAVPLLMLMCWLVGIMGLQAVGFDCLNAAQLHRLRLTVTAVASLTGGAIIFLLSHRIGMKGVVVGVYCAESLMTAAIWLTLFWQDRRRKPDGRPRSEPAFPSQAVSGST